MPTETAAHIEQDTNVVPSIGLLVKSELVFTIGQLGTSAD